MKKLLGIVVLGLLWCNISLSDIKEKLPKDISIGNTYYNQQKDFSYFKDKDYAIQIVDKNDGHPVRAGKKSVRFELRDGDCSANAGGGWNDCKLDAERYELYENKMKKGGTYWYAWSIYFPEDHFTGYPAWLTVGQFHQMNGGYPTFMFENHTGGYWLYQNITSEFYKKKGKKNKHFNMQHTVQLATEEETLGKWNDILVNVKWSTNEKKGFFKLFVNGKIKHDYKGRTIGSSSYNPFFKFGLYRYGMKTERTDLKIYPTQIVYYDEVRFAKSCEKINLNNLGYSCNDLENQKIKIKKIKIEGKYQLKWYWVDENTKTNNITKNQFVVSDMINFKKGITTFDKLGGSTIISNQYREKIEFKPGEDEEIIITGNLDLDSQQDTEPVTILLKPDPDNKGTYVGMGLWNHSKKKSKKENIKAILVPVN